jgi:hypothetical protein
MQIRHDWAGEGRNRVRSWRRIRARARAGTVARVARGIGTASRLESAALAVGLGGLALALGVTVAQATLSPMPHTADALRRAVVERGFDDALCPDGWAADHAAVTGMSEAEVTAWYLRVAMDLSDREVIAGVGLYLANAGDFRQVEGRALTRNQILLCVAEGRRLTQPLDALLPPWARGSDPLASDA